jgi:hypothetical protein
MGSPKMQNKKKICWLAKHICFCVSILRKHVKTEVVEKNQLLPYYIEQSDKGTFESGDE